MRGDIKARHLGITPGGFSAANPPPKRLTQDGEVRCWLHALRAWSHIPPPVRAISGIGCGMQGEITHIIVSGREKSRQSLPPPFAMHFVFLMKMPFNIQQIFTKHLKNPGLKGKG